MRHAFAFWIQETGTDEPLAGDLERVPLELEVLILANGGDLVLHIVLVDQVLDNCEGFPMLCVPSE